MYLFAIFKILLIFDVVAVVLRRLFGLRIIGLTGGIASGKTTTRKILEKNHVQVIDFDEIARKVVEPGTPALDKIVASFGSDVLSEDGTLDRIKLGTICFKEKSKLRVLNSIMASPMRMCFLKMLFEKFFVRGCGLVIVDAPLLFERRFQTICSQTMLVYVSAETQLERLMKRDNIGEKFAKSKIAAQLPLDVKKQMADAVVTNDGDLDRLDQQVHAWWNECILPKEKGFWKFVPTLSACVISAVLTLSYWLLSAAVYALFY